MKPLTQEQALLRVAMMVAQADGAEDARERATASTVLAKRLAGLDDTALDRLVRDALRDVGGVAQAQVLAALKPAFPDRAGRLEAMHVACQVALADKRLAWQESREMLDFAASLGLARDDVTAVLHTYWPPRAPRAPTRPGSG